jgi:tRNA U34 5-carboxymethylaminomethyl modifying GTPase MnmE/TrmE
VISVSVDWSDLRTYTRAKQAIAGVVRRLDSHFHNSGDELRTTACRELMVKLAEGRFTLAVLGQFNRGKSSLMNATMGRQILPAVYAGPHAPPHGPLPMLRHG